MTMLIKIKDIVPNSWNKRGNEGIEALSASIAARGLIQPIVVRPVGKKYEIVAGERRWRACVANKAAEIEASVREIDEVEARALTLVENMERKRLSPFEEMEGIAGLHDAGQSVEEIAAVIGRSMSFVRRRLLLKNLDLEAISQARGGADISELPLLALELLAAAPAERRENVPAYVLDSVGCMRNWLMQHEYDVGRARWLKDDTFNDLPTCEACDKRTLADGVLFPELAEGEKDICLSPECWSRKALEFAQRVAAKKSKLVDVVLIGENHDLAPMRDAGVQRSCDFLPAKKGEDGALQAVYADGQNAGQAVWVKPVRQERAEPKPKAKTADPEAKKWKWICEEVSRSIETRDYNELPVHDDSIEPLFRIIRDMVRYGVATCGIGWDFENFESLGSELLSMLENGAHLELLRIAKLACESNLGIRQDVHTVLEVFFGLKAGEVLGGIEAEWDESGGKGKRK